MKPPQLRKAFIETLTELARKDDRVILIIGDVGFSFLEPFIKEFPNQFLNAGIAEQNMMGMAAGMAYAGWRPVIYTMRNFIAFRPFEQVRNDIAYSNANVKLFGVAGGASYAFLGHSHNVYKNRHNEDEDVAMLQDLPNMRVFRPETEALLSEKMIEDFQRKGPSYFII